MYVLPLCFFSTRNSWGLFFFPSVFASAVWHWLVGRVVKSMEMPPGCGMFLAGDHPCVIFQSCIFASEGYPGGLMCLTNILWLLWCSWGCCHGEEGFCYTDKGVKKPGAVFLLPQLRGVCEAWQGPAPLRPGRIEADLQREKWSRQRDTVRSQSCPSPRIDPTPCICAWTCHSRGKVLITQLLLSDISVAVPFGRGRTIKQADMNNLLVCLADSCQDQQSHVIYLSTCVISFFSPPKEA